MLRTILCIGDAPLTRERTNVPLKKITLIHKLQPIPHHRYLFFKYFNKKCDVGRKCVSRIHRQKNSDNKFKKKKIFLVATFLYDLNFCLVLYMMIYIIYYTKVIFPSTFISFV